MRSLSRDAVWGVADIFVQRLVRVKWWRIGNGLLFDGSGGRSLR